MKITLNNKGSNVLLSDLLHRASLDIAMPCAGNHSCGKCKVKAGGELSPISAAEACFLTQKEIDSGIRLACFARVTGDVCVELPEEGAAAILQDEYSGESKDNDPMISPGKYGLAIDIGTTTIVSSLYGANGAKCAASVSDLNRQRRFGADVISRINYAIENSLEEVHECVRAQLEEMIEKICEKGSVARSDIEKAVVAGNTTMLHFFAGLDPKGIGFYPFKPQSLFNCEVRTLTGIPAYVPPCISAYVGADLVCCVLASGMARKKETSFIVDIGTNGEMGLMAGGVLYCCSTAAGPAFEGAGISCGKHACAGAISGVFYDEASREVRWETIDGAEPSGVCGSGLIDAVAMLLLCDAIDEHGRLKQNGHRLASCVTKDARGLRFVFPGTDIYITQEDIRKFQLAKGAIYAGIKTLLMRAGIKEEELDVFYICGGFGTYLNLESAEKTGLIPAGMGERAVVLGNGSIKGAAMILTDKKNIETIEHIVKINRYIELSADAEFMEQYIQAMSFAANAVEV